MAGSAEGGRARGGEEDQSETGDATRGRTRRVFALVCSRLWRLLHEPCAGCSSFGKLHAQPSQRLAKMMMMDDHLAKINQRTPSKLADQSAIVAKCPSRNQSIATTTTTGGKTIQKISSLS